MRVLIVGGNGFIGSHVQDVLLGREHSVRVLDVKPERYREPLHGVDYRDGSSADEATRTSALSEVDTVLYLASTCVPATSNDNVSLDIATNLVPLAATLDAMVQVGVKRIVYFSSGGTVYGPTEMSHVPEHAPLDPICSYGIVKLAAEKYLGMYQHLYGISPLVLRPSNPFGPRQGHQGVQGFVGTSLVRMLRDEPLEIWGDGSVVRDYVYVQDVALAAALALESDATGAVNVGSGEGRSLLDMVGVLCTATGIEPEIRYKESRALDVPRLVLDVRRARDLLGWTSTTSLADGIAAHWQWLRDQPGQRPSVDD